MGRKEFLFIDSLRRESLNRWCTPSVTMDRHVQLASAYSLESWSCILAGSRGPNLHLPSHLRYYYYLCLLLLMSNLDIQIRRSFQINIYCWQIFPLPLILFSGSISYNKRIKIIQVAFKMIACFWIICWMVMFSRTCYYVTFCLTKLIVFTYVILLRDFKHGIHIFSFNGRNLIIFFVNHFNAVLNLLLVNLWHFWIKFFDLF